MPKQNGNKRKRVPSDEQNIAPSAKNSKLAKYTGIEDVPPEIFRRILGEVVTALDLEREVGRALTSVAAVSAAFKEKVLVSPAGRYLESLNEAREAAKRSDALLPKSKFPDAGPVRPFEYADMAARGIRLLSSKKELELVDKVLYIKSTASRAHALDKMASHSAGMSKASRSHLLDSALDILEHPEHRSGAFHACKAVAKLYSYRTPEQDKRIADAMNADPTNALEIRNELDYLALCESSSTTANSPVLTATRSGKRQYISKKQKVKLATEDIQAKLGHAEEARTFLMNSMRERDGRS